MLKIINAIEFSRPIQKVLTQVGRSTIQLFSLQTTKLFQGHAYGMFLNFSGKQGKRHTDQITACGYRSWSCPHIHNNILNGWSHPVQQCGCQYQNNPLHTTSFSIISSVLARKTGQGGKLCYHLCPVFSETIGHSCTEPGIHAFQARQSNRSDADRYYLVNQRAHKRTGSWPTV